jgi:hypothetical protein
MADQLLAGLPPVLDFNGDVVAGGSVTFYETNTTTPVAIWSDIAATIPLANPLTLDSAGRPSNQIFYVGTVAVKEVIKDAGGATLYTVDPSPRFSVTAAAASGVTYAPIASNPSLNVQDAIDFVSLSSSVFPSIVGKAGKAPYVNGGATAVEYIDSLGYLCTATGADTIVLATGLDLNTLTTGVIVGWIQATTNTGAATVEVDNVVAAPLVLDAGGAVAAGELTIGKYYSASYDGTNWVLIASGGGGIEYTRKTANYTLSRGEGVIADTTGGTFTVTLPATPATGDSVVISDGGDWSVTNLTVGRNGSTIEGDAADMTMDVGGVSVTFIYDATTWQIYTTAASDTGQYATAAQGALADTAVQPSTSPTLTGLTLTGAATGTDLTLSSGVYLGGVAAANKLDDYEEGTFVPFVNTGTTGSSYTSQFGFYKKIGKIVTFSIDLKPLSQTGTAAPLTLGGLPFLSSTTASEYGGAFINYQTSFITAAQLGTTTFHVSNGNTIINFYNFDGNDFAGSSAASVNQRILISGFYHSDV